MKYSMLPFDSQKTMYGANVILFEGILTFYDPDVRKACKRKTFSNCK